MCSAKVSKYKYLSKKDKFDNILNKNPKNVKDIYSLSPNLEKLYIL